MADKSLTPIDLPELSVAPASPASGFHRFYAKTDGKAYSKSSAGTEYDLTTGVSLTTTGTSGAATLVGTTLNIPVYQSALTNPVTGTGTSGQVAYWNGTTTQTGKNNLFFDQTNNRLGINVSSPQNALDVTVGSLGAMSRNAYEAATFSTNGDTKVGIYTGSTTANGAAFVLGSSQLTASGYYPGFEFQHQTNTNAVDNQFRINGLGRAINGTVVAASTNLIRLFMDGRVIFNSSSFTWPTAASTRVLIGGSTNNGQHLQVYGSTLLRGSGTTSATTALLVQNSTPTANFTIRDDGGYAFRNGTVGLAQTGYTTFTNLTTDRTCDANATTVEELADILGTLIEDLKTKGIIAA